MKFKFLKIIISFAFLTLIGTVYAQPNAENVDSGHQNKPLKFRFKFENNDSYKIHSIVNEKVYKNGLFHHSAEIVNRINVKVSDIQTKENLRSALFTASFMTSEQNSNKTFGWSRQYPSIFRRDELGFYDIDNTYFMPVVRNIPTFPDKPLNIGDSWEGEGHEAHDFRDSFGIEKPFIIPFKVKYQYIGKTKIEGKEYDHITAQYTLDYSVPQKLLKEYKKDIDIPVMTFGNSKQNLYWDSKKGNLVIYNEEFHIKLMLYSGSILDFIGSAEARIIETKKLDKREEKKIKKDIKKLKLKDTNVKNTEEGLTISLEKIKFLPESAELLDSEKEKIKKIAKVLSKFSKKEFLISGHTALAGTEDGRQKLSEERASAVANYLIELGVQKREYIYTRGLGATKPVVANDSKENMAKNRRVEITILNE